MKPILVVAVTLSLGCVLGCGNPTETQPSEFNLKGMSFTRASWRVNGVAMTQKGDGQPFPNTRNYKFNTPATFTLEGKLHTLDSLGHTFEVTILNNVAAFSESYWQGPAGSHQILSENLKVSQLQSRIDGDTLIMSILDSGTAAPITSLSYDWMEQWKEQAGWWKEKSTTISINSIQKAYSIELKLYR
jgi:hypothetical protein